jgi:hypothetical protein
MNGSAASAPLNDTHSNAQANAIQPRGQSIGFAKSQEGGLRGQTYATAANNSYLGGPLVAVQESTCPGFPTGPASLVLHYRKLDATNRDSLAWGNFANVPASYYFVALPNAAGTLRYGYGGSTVGTTELDVAGLTYGDDVWVFCHGARGMEVWQNGILRGSNAANPTRTGTVNYTGLFAGLGLAAFDSDNAESGCALVYNRQLEVPEIQALTIDPWTPFRPARRFRGKVGAAGVGVGRSFSPFFG